MKPYPLDALSPKHQAEARAQIGAADRSATERQEQRESAGEPPVGSSSSTAQIEALEQLAKATARRGTRGRACWEDGYRFDSETERRVYRRLRDELAAAGDADVRLFHKPTFPLWTLEAPAPGERNAGRPRTITPDFAIVRGLRLERVIDAKPSKKKARSRDWPGRKAAFDRCYAPLQIEEVDR